MDRRGDELLAAWWAHSTGGSSVAVKPGDRVSAMPQGPRAAGVDSVLDFVRQGLEAAKPHVGFLVGGPGGGKSHAVAEFVRELELVGPVDETQAHRAYRYRTRAGSGLYLVNDATIPPHDGEPRTLIDEIDSAITAGDCVLVCINRGVVIEEAGKAASDAATCGALVVRWLSAGRAEGEADYVRALDLPGAAFQAAFLDTCSLLEVQPVVDGSGSALRAGDYRVAHLADRWEEELLPTPAAEVLASAVAATEGCWPSFGALDPVAANFSALGDPHLRGRVLTMLRAAEVFHGTRLTYRELWGIFARSALAGLPSIMGPDAARRWIEERAEALQAPLDTTPSTTPADRWRTFMELSRVRTHSALFTWTFGETDPVLRFVSQVDPIRDARPGEWDASNRDPAASGWATPVQEAFAGQPGDMGSDEDQPGPLALLMRYCRCSGPDGCSVLARYVSEFDREVDRAYMQLRKHGAAAQERELVDATREYARLLTRLYATAHGIPAFAREIAEWLRARRKGGVEGSLRDGLEALLRPSSSRGTDSYLPLLASRMVPVTDPQKALLTVPVPRLDLEVRCEGDDMALVVRPERSADTFPMPLDFSLVREAMAASGGQSGVTERSLVTSARIERIRAGLVRDRSEVVALSPECEPIKLKVAP